MKHKAVKIGLTSLVLVLAFGGLLYIDPERGHRVLQARRRGDGAARRSGTARSCSCTAIVVPNSILQKPNTLDYRFQVAEQRPGRQRQLHRRRARHVQGRGSEVVLKGTLSPDGFQVQPNGVMAKCPSKYEAKPGGATPDRHVPEEAAMAALGAFLLLPGVRGRGLLRSPPRSSAPGGATRARRERHRRLLPRHRADDGRLGRHHLRVRHRRLLHQVRPALLRQRAAAVLQDHLVLGRARRLDHVLGVPAVAASARSPST